MKSNPGIIQQLVSVCEQAFVCLQIPVTSKELEDLATAIHRSMSMEARHFHTPEHVLHLANAADLGFQGIQAIERLGAYAPGFIAMGFLLECKIGGDIASTL